LGDACAEPDTFAAFSSLLDVQGPPFDHILVCVKSFDSGHAARDIHRNRHLLAQSGCVVLFQNGWGNAQVFTRYFAEEHVYNARVITGFVRLEEHLVAVTVHADAIHIGNLYSGDVGKIATLCEAIAVGGIPCQGSPYIEKDLWAKMLFNCSLNALGAILGVPYGSLGRSEQTRQVMGMIVQEVFAVMQAAGYTTHWPSPTAYLEVFYNSLIPLTAEHFSSTLQDLRAGKRTEIDALNGAIMALGQAHGVPTPANQVVYHIIRYLEGQLEP
jgi:2-dehydropantoate 2-reductase